MDEHLKESMEYYIEAATEADFVDDETMYDAFPQLGACLENVGIIKQHSPPAPETPPEGGLPTSPTGMYLTTYVQPMLLPSITR